MMNILLIPAFFKEKKRPTLGSFFLEQAKALQKAGNKVTVLYCDTYSVKYVAEWINYKEQKAEVIDGVTIYRKKCFCPLKHGMEGHREAFAKAVIELYEEYIESKNEAFDVIHAHCAVWAGYAAMKLSQKTKISYVITEHATLFQLHKSQIKEKNNKIISETFQNAAKVICVSKAFAQLLSEYRQDIEIIGNVVDCELFNVNACQKADKSGKSFRFLTVCYMQNDAQLYKKGMDILLQAWSRLQKIYPESELIIGGGGQALKKAVEWCEEYKISDSVRFIGALSRQEVAEQMKLCDCFVLPSRYETFGVVYIEAFACGKPVIAGKNGGPDEFVKPFNGLLIPTQSTQALTEAMQAMIEQRECYDANQIRDYVVESFSETAIVNQLMHLYKSIL